MSHLNQFTHSNLVRPDSSLFVARPGNVSCYFYDTEEMIKDAVLNDRGEISFDVCDSQYAIMDVHQFYEFWRRFDEFCQHDEDPNEYMALLMQFPLGGNDHFVMVVDEGGLTYELEKYCTEQGIDSQFHVDQPYCKTDGYDYTDDESGEDLNPITCWNSDTWVLEHVYTGAGDDFPHLIRALHTLQEE